MLTDIIYNNFIVDTNVRLVHHICIGRQRVPTQEMKYEEIINSCFVSNQF